MTTDTSPRVLESRVVYEGRIFDAVVDRVVMAEGTRPFQVEVVRHAPSVGIVAMPTTDSVMLVRQYRHAAAAWLWELPAGSLDPGEDAEAAARRECQEELGLIAGRVEAIGSLLALPGYCTEEMTFFSVTGLREPGPDDPEAQQDEDEDIEARSFTLTEVREMVRRGEVRDMKTVAALALL